MLASWSHEGVLFLDFLSSSHSITSSPFPYLGSTDAPCSRLGDPVPPSPKWPPHSQGPRTLPYRDPEQIQLLALSSLNYTQLNRADLCPIQIQFPTLSYFAIVLLLKYQNQSAKQSYFSFSEWRTSPVHSYITKPILSQTVYFHSFFFPGISLCLCTVKKIQGLVWISAFIRKKQNISIIFYFSCYIFYYKSLNMPR